MQQSIILAYLQNINFYRAQSTKRPWWPWVASHGIPSHRCLWAQECYSLPVLSCTVGIPAFQPLFLPNGPPWAHLAYWLPLTSWRFWMDPVTSPSLCIPCSDPVQLCPAGGCTVHTGCQAPISPFSKQGVSPHCSLVKIHFWLQRLLIMNGSVCFKSFYFRIYVTEFCKCVFFFFFYNIAFSQISWRSSGRWIWYRDNDTMTFLFEKKCQVKACSHLLCISKVCSVLLLSTKSFLNFHCHEQRGASFGCLEQKWVPEPECFLVTQRV